MSWELPSVQSKGKRDQALTFAHSGRLWEAAGAGLGWPSPLGPSEAGFALLYVSESHDVPACSEVKLENGGRHPGCFSGFLLW